MSLQSRSLVRRALVQMDLAFWYLHAHPWQLATLGAPTLVALASIAVGSVAALRTWELPGVLLYAIFGVLVPTIVFWVVVFAPLPSAVFAWRRAAGVCPEAGECFASCWSRAGRLTRVGIRLFFTYLLWFVLFGLPMLVFWPRTCLAPVVALFDDDRRVFMRSKRLLKEDLAINVLASLYLGVFLALGLLLFLPRLWMLAQSAMKKSPGGMFETSGSRWIWDHLWIVETLGGCVLLAAVAVGWCLSITLLYRDIRVEREGELLTARIREAERDFLGAAAPPRVEATS